MNKIILSFIFLNFFIKICAFPAQTCPPTTKSYSFNTSNYSAFGLAVLPNILTVGAPLSDSGNYSNLWYNYLFSYYQSFTVIVNVNKVVSSNGSYYEDGSTIVIAKSISDSGAASMGAGLGYHGAFNEVIGEFDMFLNSSFNDSDWTTISIHECTNNECSAFENPAWSTELIIDSNVSNLIKYKKHT